jgi:hypothetical protein
MARRLTIYRGVRPVCIDLSDQAEAGGPLIGRQLLALELVPRGSTVVIVSINPDLTRTDANYLRIRRV